MHRFPPSTPRAVEGGITTKKQAGRIGESWWSQRWIRVLESFNIGARLARGRSYARSGQVISLDIKPGMVIAKVQGSRVKPYTVEIKLDVLGDAKWDKVVQAMAARALFAAKLLAGEMPTTIEEAFAQAHCTLFPAHHADLKTECSCPDDSNPCKHIAAVYYLLADRFDEDPFLLFSLRGRTKDHIIAALRAQRVKAAPASKSADVAPVAMPRMKNAVPPLETDPIKFWRAGDELAEFRARPEKPVIHAALLKQLGPFPINGFDALDEFSRAYGITSQAALDRALR